MEVVYFYLHGLRDYRARISCVAMIFSAGAHLGEQCNILGSTEVFSREWRSFFWVRAPGKQHFGGEDVPISLAVTLPQHVLIPNIGPWIRNLSQDTLHLCSELIYYNSTPASSNNRSIWRCQLRLNWRYITIQLPYFDSRLRLPLFQYTKSGLANIFRLSPKTGTFIIVWFWWNNTGTFTFTICFKGDVHQLVITRLSN